MVDQSGRVAKLSDLGLARTWEPSSGIMTAETGSYRWMAPEVMMHKEYTHLCDIYSYGIMLWELVTGEVPWREKSAVECALDVATKRAGLTPPSSCHPALSEIMRNCWSYDPSDRWALKLQVIDSLESSIVQGGTETLYARETYSCTRLHART